MSPFTSPHPLFSLPLFCIALVMIGRYTAVIVGLFKDPLLHIFEKYGDEENHFEYLPRLMIGSGALLYTTRGALFYAVPIPSEIEMLGVLMMLFGFLYTRLPVRWKARTLLLPKLPAWYYRLYEETNRVERRRLAYMWLRLPRRTRWTYNTNDHAFFLWADLVILATAQPAQHEFTGNQEAPSHVRSFVQTTSR